MGRHRVKLVKFPMEKLPVRKAGPYQAAQWVNICADLLMVAWRRDDCTVPNT
jgi:hypothetical protein